MIALVVAAWADPPPIVEPAYRVHPDGLVVRTAPEPGASVRGAIAAGASFRTLGPATGPNCAAGWSRVEAQGFVCLDGTAITHDPPRPQPEVLEYDPPDPSEYATYVETGEYHARVPTRIVPGIYARRYRRFAGKLYASAEAYERNEAPVGQLSHEIGAKERFVSIRETSRGPVLVRGDGQVAALSDVYLYPVSRLAGFDLENHPLRAGTWPAFAIDYQGASIRKSASAEAEVVGTVPYHGPLVISSTPADPTGHWWEVVEGPVRGFVEDTRGIRHPVTSPSRPPGVGDSELWVDVELGQQVVMVHRGDALVYFTLTSTGAAPMGTPTGTYRLIEKHAFKDMRSRPDADDWYAVEDVPWTLTFRPRYSLHTAYWHWGYGRTASHGCVNLSARDAAWLYDQLPPKLPDGWTSLYVTPDDHPAVVRVRRGATIDLDDT
ncbi:MAG: L,D-transpeptidase [Myxococcota bacterium]